MRPPAAVPGSQKSRKTLLRVCDIRGDPEADWKAALAVEMPGKRLCHRAKDLLIGKAARQSAPYARGGLADKAIDHPNPICYATPSRKMGRLP